MAHLLQSHSNADSGILKVNDFEPYTDNAGTSVAIAGENFAVIASDTRLVQGYNVLSREQSKLCRLNNKVYLATNGCWCDCLAFAKAMELKLRFYTFDHNKHLNASSAARLAANTLYSKRFFPYYVNLIVAGLDQDGKGVVYTYDPVGCCCPVKYDVGGAGTSFIYPFLDNQLNNCNDELKDFKPLTKERAVSLIHDSLSAAAERHLNIGDGIKVAVITSEGVEELDFTIRSD